MFGSILTHDASHGNLEPGLHRILRILAVLQIVGISVFRRLTGSVLGIDIPLTRFFALTMPVPLVLLALVWIPWFGRRIGRALLPAVLVILSANALVDKYVTLAWLVPAAQRELDLVLLMLRLWLMLHVITLLVAWQYFWRWALWVSLALSAADGLLSLPFKAPGSSLNPLFDIMFAMRAGTVTLVAVGVGWLLERQREQKAALAVANRKLANYAATAEQLAISQERTRLARELHDTLAHSLSAVTVQMEAVHALWEANAQSARSLLESALNNARSGLTEARRALQALRASPLDDVGLGVAVGNLARSAAARANLRLDLNALADLRNLPADREQCVYRVAQETLANVVRHARATELRVVLERADGGLTLTVADNGQGFDESAVDTRAHFGSKGMRERVEMVGGRFTTETEPGSGATVRVTVPLGDRA